MYACTTIRTTKCVALRAPFSTRRLAVSSYTLWVLVCPPSSSGKQPNGSKLRGHYNFIEHHSERVGQIIDGAGRLIKMKLYIINIRDQYRHDPCAS